MNISFDPSFWINFLSHPSTALRQFFVLSGAVFLLVLFLGLIVRLWLVWRQRKFRQTKPFITLGIDIPAEEIKSPKAVENIISQLYAVRSMFNFWHRFWQGQYTLQTSLEIIGRDGYVQFVAYLPRKYQILFEKAVWSQFPEAEIYEMEDYTQKIKSEELVSQDPENGKYQLWGTEFISSGPSFFPIRTYIMFSDPTEKDQFADPLCSILEIMSHLKRGEQLWYQITFTPTRKSWQAAGEQAICDIVAGKSIESKKFNYLFLFKPIANFFSGLLTTVSETVFGSTEHKNQKASAPNFLTIVPPEKELIVKAIREKISRLGFSAYIRLLYIAPKDKFDSRNVTGDFQGIIRSFNNPQMNSLGSDTKIEVDFPEFLFPKLRAKYRKKWLLQRAKMRYSGLGPDQPHWWSKLKTHSVKNIFSVEELATLWHFPKAEDADKIGLIKRVLSKKVTPKQKIPTTNGNQDDQEKQSINIDPKITFFAKTNFRRQEKNFGIKKEDRRRHMYVVGKTGMGKTTMLENMIYQDIVRGKGVAVIDPHGDLVDQLLDLVPSDRINDTIYFNPADKDYPISFNILSQENSDYRYLIASSLVGIFKKIWAHSWGPRLEYLLRNSLLTLLQAGHSTILGVPRIFVDNKYRKKLVAQIDDPVVKNFWTHEYAKYHNNFQVEAVSPIQNKIGQFISIPLIRNMIGQVKSKLNFQEIINDKKILLVNLAKGLIGEDVSSLLGATIINKLQIAAMTRANKQEDKREDFYLYIDEFQNFSTESFATILSEARKYRLNLIMAHQYIDQLDDLVATAIFGNVGTMVSFGVGAEDAEVLESHFAPEFTQQDLVNLGKYEIILRLMINGVSSRAFSAETLPPLGAREVSSRDKIIKVSRERYTVEREVIEDKLGRWLGAGGQKKKQLRGRKGKK